ncbi:hypothetical protein FIBSPDRAFT_960117 [Athelia psychrophila]|uniref:Uncharacterized protein n=1 Tax=Athelia psychrophila TaxID=1759441 RepID=A0A166CRN8_9AGAM|nr:hypothetical protein FIBSPDRAFT_960117 [Fibularhizoctonia sp. CBS 109695]
MSSLTNSSPSHTPHARPDDDGSQNGSGGMQRKTTAGIAIALICFFSLLGGFYIVSKWHRSSARPRTRDDEESEMTYRRWADNVAGPGKERRARLQQEQQRSGFQPAPPYSPRRSSSSASTKTPVPLDINTTLSPMPASPLPIYIPTGRNESSQVNRPVSLQGEPTL